MRRFNLLTSGIMLVFITSIISPRQGFSQSAAPRPEEHFGFIPGSDYMLFNYEQLIEYLTKLDKASPMLRLVKNGQSPMGKKMYLAFISSEKNINNLDRLREINRELALNPNLSETKQAEYIKDGRAFFLATLSMHSTEVAPAQAAPLIAYKLITSNDPLVRKYLDDVVYMMVPNHNPDGMDFVVENYNKYKGTQYEGASLPRVYHKYVGHDNNRDFVTLTQEDTKAIARIYNLDWFPQVMIEKHQMGSTRIRYFVPPAHDPIAENVDAELWTWTGIFGTNMLRDLTNAGLAGVGQKTIYDDYWPGSTETCIWKNDILKFRNDLCKREVEKGKTQPPYYYVVPLEQADQSELVSLVELMKEQGINTFRLSEDHTLSGINLKAGDIVYPLSQPFRAFVKEVMEKQEFPVRHYTPGGQVVRPYDVTSWSLPLHRGLVSHEIKIRDAAFEAKLKPLTGDYNPLKEGYKLPAIFPATSNGSFKAAFIAVQNGLKVGRLSQETKINGKTYGKGSFVIQGNNEDLLNSIVKESRTEPGFVREPEKLELSALSLPRIALVETYFSDMDAGWTRYLFDTYKLPYTILHPDEFEKADFAANFDIVIIPSSGKNLLMNGKPGTETSPSMSNYHPDYRKGMGKKGLEKLMLFVDGGGKVISWGQSTDLFTGMLEITRGETKEEFMLPFTNGGIRHNVTDCLFRAHWFVCN